MGGEPGLQPLARRKHTLLGEVVVAHVAFAERFLARMEQDEGVSKPRPDRIPSPDIVAGPCLRGQ